jgi:hypothetical protein
MEGLKKHYDRVVLIVAAVIAVAVSALIAVKSFAFADRFKETPTTPGEDYGPTDPAAVNTAATAFDAAAEWKVPTMQGQPDKQLKLFRSVTIVEKDGVVYDLLDPASPPLRAPMSNKFLVDNNLDFKRDDVGSLDPDGDGFTNAEEAEAQSNPRDAKVHPPLSKHLYVAEIVLDPYTLEFKGEGGGTFTVRRTQPANSRSMFGKLGENFEDSKGDGARFKILKYSPLKEKDEKGMERDKSTLELEDAKNPGKNIVLEYKIPHEMPIKHAVFGYRHEGFESWRKDVKEGDTFQLPNDPSATFKLDTVEADGSARISQSGGSDGNPKVIEVPSK